MRYTVFTSSWRLQHRKNIDKTTNVRRLSCIGRYKDFICIKKQFHFLLTCFMKTLMISMPADWTGKFIWRCPGLDSLSSVFTFLQQNNYCDLKDQSVATRLCHAGLFLARSRGMSRTVLWLDNLKVSRVFCQRLLLDPPPCFGPDRSDSFEDEIISWKNGSHPTKNEPF